ncbi:hypothetical protein C8R45DRAFT_1175444 [Mycena sanguinolenta]|nr:hypothetical protein C8R45DRAFT_1175444 [Mycena sanguinolenta]
MHTTFFEHPPSPVFILDAHLLPAWPLSHSFRARLPLHFFAFIRSALAGASSSPWSLLALGRTAISGARFRHLVILPSILTLQFSAGVLFTLPLGSRPIWPRSLFTLPTLHEFRSACIRTRCSSRLFTPTSLVSYHQFSIY